MGIGERLRAYARSQRELSYDGPRHTERGTDLALAPPDFLNAECTACEAQLVNLWRQDEPRLRRASELAEQVTKDGQAVYGSAIEVLEVMAMIGMMPAVAPNVPADRRFSSTAWLAEVCAAQLTKASTDEGFERILRVLLRAEPTSPGVR